MSAAVISVCTSARRGIPKRSVASARLRAGHGIVGDAHAGPGHRQVSLLDLGDIDKMRARGLRLAAGAFGENIVITGLDTRELGIGSRLAVGDDVVLEISQRGKVCHKPCAIYHRTGDCIMPRQGLFATVVGGGRVAPGDVLRVLRLVPAARLQGAVVGAGEAAAMVATVLTQGVDVHLAWQGVLAGRGAEAETALFELCGRGLDLVVVVDPAVVATVERLEREPDLEATVARRGLGAVVTGTCAGAVVVSLPGTDAGALLAGLLGALVDARERLRAAGVGASGVRPASGSETAPGTGATVGRAAR